MLLLAAALAHAQSTDASKYWQSVYDARLVDALGDPGVSSQLLVEQLDGMPADHPERGEALYWLGRVRLDEGNAEEAERLFREAAGFPLSQRDATIALARLELARAAIPRLPASCTFERDTCGFLRGWESVDKGALELRDEGDLSVLAWDTNVRGAEFDSIRVALAPGLPARGLTMKVRATEIAADLRVVVRDGSGGAWASPVFVVPTDAWLPIDLSLTTLAPLSPSTQGATPRGVRVIELDDISGMLSTERGPNTLLLDELTIR